MTSHNSTEKKATIPYDLESQEKQHVEIVEDIPLQSCSGYLRKLTGAGIEMRGLEPVPAEQRNHTKYYNIFTLFGGSFLTLLP